MAIKKDLTEQMNILVDYIMDKTADSDAWITLTYRDISKIVGTTPGSSVTKRLMESLKEHENILFKLNLDPSKSKKPLKFKFVDKETKYKAIDNKRYQKLTEEEVEFIKDTLGYRDHNELYNILSFVNFLKSRYDGKSFAMPSSEELSDTLVILEQDVEDIITFLSGHNILVDEGGTFRLSLKGNNLKLANSTDINEIIEPILPKDLQCMDDKPPEQAVSILFEQLERQQLGLRAYIEEKVLSRINETATLKEQLDKGHEMLQKVLKENQALRDENQELKLNTGKLEAKLDKSIRFKDDLINAAQEYLQIFNWQVQQVALRDSNMSADAKNTKAYRARLSQQYVDVGQEFYQGIINFTKDYY